MNKIGIMQGRLLPSINGQIQVFPGEDWHKEFEIAQQVGIDCIEWIYDKASEHNNPLISDDGIKQIQEVSEKYNVKTRSLCADYFMVHPLFSKKGEALGKTRDKMRFILEQAKKINVNRVVIPFVDSSSINNEQKKNDVIVSLDEISGMARNLGIEIQLETDLSPEDFRSLLESLNDPLIKVNYDSGNSASLGYKPANEFSAYGDKIGSVHIKDRVLHGTTVPLGKGDTDFCSLFKELKNINYTGDFILQVARDKDGEESVWAKQNMELVKSMIIKYELTS